MPRPTLLVGVPLDILNAFAASPSVSDQCLKDSHRPTNARAVVVAIDLRDAPSPDAAKEQLRTSGSAATEEAQRHLQLEHFFIIYTAAGNESELLARGAAELASQAHAAFERELATVVDVIVLDVSTCGP